MNNNQNVERFRSIIATINRPGIDKLMKFIEEKSDFYTAPASTKYHLSCEGGLLQHSLNVYDALMQLKTVEPLRTALARHDNASIAIVALFHDLCKTMFYKVSTRNVKNEETGKWEKVPYYTIEDTIPYGHGEKSVMMMESLQVRLTNAEKYAIRWHMGAYEPKENYNALNAAFERYPLALALHIADMVASNITEDKQDNRPIPPKSADFDNVG